METMPHREAKSAFLSLLFILVGLVISAGIVLAFVPLVECFVCTGNPRYQVPPARSENSPFIELTCGFCEGRGRVSLRAQWFMSETWREYFEVRESVKAMRRRNLTRPRTP